MNYLFLDVEWQKGEEASDLVNDTMLQIGAIQCNESFSVEREFYQIIRPDNIDLITDETIRFMRLSRKQLLLSKLEKEVMDAFKRKFYDFEVLIIWSQDAYDVFEQCLKKNKIHLPKCHSAN